jgi:hypothetical protein
MDRIIATQLLQQELQRARERGYASLAANVGEETTREIVGPDGKQYQISVLVVWDRDENGTLRVIVSIDDGGWRAFKPLTADDLIHPDTNAAG